MKKLRTIISFLLLISMALPLFGCHKTDAPDSPDTEQSETLPHGIEPVSYPNLKAVSQYNELTDDQKAAYDALGEALTDILKNQPYESKSYPIKNRVSMNDCLTVRDLLLANFAAAEDIINALVFTDSGDSVDKADTIVLNTPDDAFTQSYKDYLNLVKLADNLLERLDSDNTARGKASAIRKWISAKITSTYLDDKDSRTYLEQKPDTAYGAMVYKKADNMGVARLYDFLCKRAGLETICVKGLNSDGEVVEGSTWNMICIDAKWYHIKQIYYGTDESSQFMAPDSMIKYTSKLTAQYYYDRSSEKSIAPVADSYDMYKYAYNSIDEIIQDFESGEKLSTNWVGSYLAVLPNGGDNKLVRYTGEITSKLDGTVYYMNVCVVEASMDAEGNTDIYSISFTPKSEVSYTESGMQTIEYKPQSYTAYITDGPGERLEEDPDMNWYITMDVPDNLTSDTAELYKRFDYNQAAYCDALEFSGNLAVDSDFVMNENIIGAWEWYNMGLSGMKSWWQGKTDEGCDYIVYTPKFFEQSNCVSYDVFVRVTDRGILNFQYYDDRLVNIEEIVKSIKVINRSETTEN